MDRFTLCSRAQGTREEARGSQRWEGMLKLRAARAEKKAANLSRQASSGATAIRMRVGSVLLPVHDAQEQRELLPPESSGTRQACIAANPSARPSAA